MLADISLGFHCFTSMPFNIDHMHNVLRKRQAKGGLPSSPLKKKITEKYKMKVYTLPSQSFIITLKVLTTTGAPARRGNASSLVLIF